MATAAAEAAQRSAGTLALNQLALLGQATERCEAIGRGMAQAAIDHRNQRTVLRRDRVAGLELQRLVRADDLPVGTTGKDGTSEPRALDGATRDRDNAAPTLRRHSELKRLCHADARGKRKIEREHLSPPRLLKR